MPSRRIETVVFSDAVHPTMRPVRQAVGPREQTLAVARAGGRRRLDIHGALDPETGRMRMIDAVDIDAASTIRLFEGLEADCSTMTRIHVLPDNAREHRARAVRQWPARPDCRIGPHLVPACCSRLDVIGRSRGLMHEHVTHDRCHATCREFADAVMTFPHDTFSDDFRVIDPEDYRGHDVNGVYMYKVAAIGPSRAACSRTIGF